MLLAATQRSSAAAEARGIYTGTTRHGHRITIPTRLSRRRAKCLRAMSDPQPLPAPSVVPYGNLLTGNLVTLTLKSAHA